MSQRYRQDGGADDGRRSSQGDQRGTVQFGHQESEQTGHQDDESEEPRTSTRTEEIDRQEGLRPESEGRPDEGEMPEERQNLIEFLERQYTDDGPLASARRDELLREGCQVRIHELDLGWFRQDEE